MKFNISNSSSNTTTSTLTNDSGVSLQSSAAVTSRLNLQTAALKGLNTASQLCSEHSRRPYFKKIDVLCERLKQDLQSSDKAVVNINTHGIAWAIKDFVFVFNRIIGAWSIIRDYFYTNSKDMECVKREFDPELEKNFLAWQEATCKFVQSLSNSSERLNARNQMNGNRRVVVPQSNGHSTGSRDHMTHNGSGSAVIENEEAQLAGEYLKTAIYKPVSSKSSQVSSCSELGSKLPQVDPFDFMFGSMLRLSSDDNNKKKDDAGEGKRLYERGSDNSE